MRNEKFISFSIIKKPLKFITSKAFFVGDNWAYLLAAFGAYAS